MDTPANRKAMPKANFDAWPAVDDVAATILFLASPDNRVTAEPYTKRMNAVMDEMEAILAKRPATAR